MKRVLLLTIGLGACASRAATPPAPAPAPRTSSTPRTASAKTRPTSTLDAALAEDLAVDHAMPWSARHPLVWENFQGRPPQSGDEGARTAYGLYYLWSCKGAAFGFRVVAAFHPLRSWVKPAVVQHASENARILRHEQTHFDITEVFARRMRRQLSTLSGPCSRSDAELRSLTGRLVDEEKETQQRYDRETNHGLRTTRQEEWNVNVANMLHAVERYAQ